MENYKPKFKVLEGNIFPDVTLANQIGNLVSIHKIESEITILFFYPQDDTPTCTKEACGIRDNLDRLKDYGCKIYGISTDNAKSHQKFIEKFKLNFDLLTDSDHLLASELGIWGKKQMFGKEYDGLHRVTYVLNKVKNIHRIIYPVDSSIHSQQIIDAINS